MSLPQDQRAIIADGARLYRDWSNSRKAALHQEYVQKIQDKGLEVHVTTAAEKEQFKELSQGPVMEYIVEQVGQELVDGLLVAVEESEQQVRGF
jgi:C4-dicarboxylate-binding protein DctP